MMQIQSSAFSPNDWIPKRYSGEGKDVSPALSWTGAPDGTVEFALICDDPDAPTAEPWVHWVAYHIPGNVSSLSEGDAGGATEGENDFGNREYNGPMPPRGHGTHHYHFKLYALDQPLSITEPGATKADVLNAMEGHILEQAELIGTYER
jgi:Raf kinase inhibitor-like YbhB/YbcL family protein